MTVLKGKNGSGKSTLLYVLMKVFDISEGKIYVGQTSLGAIKREDWLKFAFLIPQKVQFFSGTILNNLSLWDENPNLDLLERILKRLDLLDLIYSLPDGFNTQLGLEGWQLSNGQSQMFGLARLIYKDPEFILLDEPDSALDKKYKAILNSVLQELKEAKKTILLVTHNEALVNLADEVIILDSEQSQEAKA